MYSLSVCADTVFLSLPFVERVKKIAATGFLAEFWNWKGRDVEAVASDSALRISAFTGYTKGSMVHPDGVQEFLAGVRESVAVAAKLHCKSLFLSAGELDSVGQVVHQIARHPATKWITAYKTLCQVADLAEKHDVTYALEHLNTKVDHPGFAFPLVEDALNLLIQVGSPRIKLLLDVYHSQIEEGNLVEVIRQCRGRIGHVHVADVPGRHEPGTGEINYQRIAELFREIGYEGVIGLEAFPKSDDMEAIRRFREVFS
jgi:hydroxypyruvate isomerase